MLGRHKLGGTLEGSVGLMEWTVQLAGLVSYLDSGRGGLCMEHRTRGDLIECVYSFNLKISNTGLQTATREQSTTNRNMHNKQTKKRNIVSKQDKGVEM